ncbi:MAG TPA: VOC family protein [Acidimicrobiales bacterium]|nr:VOC family protein [Acidimicrobiales bacterium]
MTDALTASSEVDVAVDPDTAFKAFTEEMDLWWVRGPINYWADAGRVVEVRCEPGVGGRIIEVLDRPEEVFERARITDWEPGSLLAFDSALDDVRTEVRFEPTDTGTRVVVQFVIPAGGVDTGGTTWFRVVPTWFADWCARRDHMPHDQIDIARISVGVYYARPAAAARWLADVFGFGPAGELPQDPDPLPETKYGHPWIEFRIGNAALMIFKLDGERTGDVRTHVPWVYVDDLDAHYAHAKGSGATIVEELAVRPGSSSYVADDIEGNRWTFLQARPAMR